MPEQITLKNWTELRLKETPSRSTRNPKTMARLKADIMKRGIRNPIRITPDGEVTTGEGRAICAIELRLVEVPCIVTDGPLTEYEFLVEQVQENEVREDFNKVDLGEKLFRMIAIKTEQLGDETEARAAVAAELDICDSDITKVLALPRLPQQVQQLVKDEKLAYTSAYYIARLPTPDAQIELAERTVKYKLSRQQVISAVNAQLRVAKRQRPDPIHGKTAAGMQYTFPGTMTPDEMVAECDRLRNAIRSLAKSGEPATMLARLVNPPAN